VGMAESFVVTQPEQAEATGEKFRTYVLSPVLSKIKADFNNFEVYDVEPLSIPDILAERPVILFGKYKGAAAGEIVLRGISGGGKSYSSEIKVNQFKANARYSALRYLWARHRIGQLADYNRITETDELRKEITNLCLTYNLLTDYTSFIAIDERIRNVDGKIIRVEQPLPMPLGVSDYAVGETAAFRSMGAVQYAPSAAGKMSRLETVKDQNDFMVDGLEMDSIQILLTDIKINVESEKSSIRSFIESHLSSLQKCYEKNISSMTLTSGRVTIKFSINKNGNIENGMVFKNDLADKKFETCLLKEIKSWKIPVSGGNDQISVECTFEFNR